MTRPSAKHAFLALPIAALIGIAGFGGTAFADPPSSSLVAAPSAPLTLDPATSVNVNVNLDSNCSSAFKVGQTYTVNGSSSDANVATVSVSSSEPLHCRGDRGPFTATMTVTTLHCGHATITFDPVAGPAGIQKKLTGTTVAVDVAGPNCGSTTPPESL